MTQTLEVDLDSPPTAPTPRRRAQLPWVLFGLTLAALAISLAFRMPDPIAAESAAEPTPAPTNPAIESETSGGVSPGPTVWRDPAGGVVAVMLPVRPDAYEPVSCRLVVDDQEITDEGTNGMPAVCVWVRGSVN